MPHETHDRTVPDPGEDLPLAATVQEARIALQRSIVLLREFQKDTHYPVVTRSEAEAVITAIQEADKLAAKLDPPFIMKA
jgi:hypothetical protein